MSLSNNLSFSSGELDPILHDNVTLEKFKKGLATARNIVIGKTGSILSRFTRAHFVKAKNDGQAIKLYSPPSSSILLEWGHQYVRVYSFAGTLIADVSHALLESDLPAMHFTASGKYVYVFVYGKEMIKFLFDDVSPAFVSSSDKFAIPIAPTTLTIAVTGTPAGYNVDYAVTSVKNGEESLPAFIVSGGTYKKPIASGQSNTIKGKIDAAFSNADKYNEVRVYSRPSAGGAYGYLGSTTFYENVASALHFAFEDLGSVPDYSNNIPDSITRFGLAGKTIVNLKPRTGAVYQQRLILTDETDQEALIASRPGYQNNFYRDFPYDADSALQFKSGTTGNAKVLRIVENDGLIVFTTIGVYVSVGILGINNLALEKKGSWIIDEALPPLAVPGGVFFVDKSTNTIRQLIYSQDILTYESLDQSIFSNHLFKQKTIESWAFQEGVTPIIIVTFSDGTFATFTYNYEHQMRAWTRHDSKYPLEQVEGTGVADSSFFVTNKAGNRYIEVSLPRYIPAATFASNPEADKINVNAFMDAVKTQSTLLNNSLVGADVFLLVPTVTDDWEDDLTLTCGTSGLFTTGTYGIVGTIMRFFDPDDKSTVDLEVISRASNNQVVVRPSSLFPLAHASGFRLYATFTTVTGLSHLEGENVGILLDGYVSNSPYNDVEGYNAVTVSGGSITLPQNERGAIVVVGRPIVADIKTLNISSVEQSPTLIESLNVNKLYIRTFETRGLFCSNKFPEENTGGKDGTSLVGMEDLDEIDVPSGTEIIGNRYNQPSSKRIEKTLPGNWESNGQISIRQVDPVHFEILSIIADIEVLARSNR